MRLLDACYDYVHHDGADNYDYGLHDSVSYTRAGRSNQTIHLLAAAPKDRQPSQHQSFLLMSDARPRRRISQPSKDADDYDDDVDEHGKHDDYNYDDYRATT